MEENCEKKQVMHIASLVLGIISLATFLFWYLVIPTGVMAIVFGVKSAIRNGRTLGKVGMELGIIALSLFAFCYVGMFLILILSNM